jgi:hypothetical protein
MGMLEQYSEALLHLRAYVDQVPSDRGRVLLAATLLRMGDLEEARAEMVEVSRLKPRYTISSFRQFVSFKSPQDDEHFLMGCAKRGYPNSCDVTFRVESAPLSALGRTSPDASQCTS